MIPDRLRSDTLLPLWHEVHRRLSSGHRVSRVNVGPLGDQHRAAIADLLGWAKYPGAHASVALSELDAVLRDSVGVDARAVVTKLIGPVEDRAEHRSRAKEQRARLWDWLDTHELVAAQPALREWTARVRRAGLVGGSVQRTRQLLESALRVLRELPAEGTPLPAFAESVLGDPHALDDGTRLAGLVLRALAAVYDTAAPTSAEQRRQLWERAGVTDDELSTAVLVAGVLPADSGLPARIMRDCAASGHAATLTLAQLRSVTTWAVPHTDIWAVENPSVLAMALRRFGTACPPLVCTSGWPNSAAVRLLRLLAAAGTRLHYHGDLDGEGIRIASYVMDKTGAHPWRMSTTDYLAAPTGHGPAPHPGRVTEAPWDTDLAETVRQHAAAVPEERVAPALLDMADS